MKIRPTVGSIPKSRLPDTDRPKQVEQLSYTFFLFFFRKVEAYLGYLFGYESFVNILQICFADNFIV